MSCIRELQKGKFSFY
uniref:Uncharacterized protein n=1 Tax=Anguilla anguilla TaxID=7936 RepID=A0A0E9U497_ANGAN